MCPARKERLFARKRAADARRPNASERGYDSKWAKARRTFLARNPKCARCDAPATVVDHIIAHKGDSAVFWDTRNWQGLCDRHHNVAKQSEEKRKPPKLATPFVRAPRIPVTIVCGPAGAGKSTYVAEHRGERDLVIDLDVIRSRLAGTGLHDAAPRWLKPALEVRNQLLDGLASDTEHDRAWFIISAPEKAERDLWAKKLNANVVLLDVPLDECVRRLRASRDDAERHIQFATEWWRRYQADQAGGGPPTLAKAT